MVPGEREARPTLARHGCDRGGRPGRRGRCGRGGGRGAGQRARHGDLPGRRPPLAVRLAAVAIRHRRHRGLRPARVCRPPAGGAGHGGGGVALLPLAGPRLAAADRPGGMGGRGGRVPLSARDRCRDADGLVRHRGRRIHERSPRRPGAEPPVRGALPAAGRAGPRGPPVAGRGRRPLLPRGPRPRPRPHPALPAVPLERRGLVGPRRWPGRHRDRVAAAGVRRCGARALAARAPRCLCWRHRHCRGDVERADRIAPGQAGLGRRGRRRRGGDRRRHQRGARRPAPAGRRRRLARPGAAPGLRRGRPRLHRPGRGRRVEAASAERPVRVGETGVRGRRDRHRVRLVRLGAPGDRPVGQRRQHRFGRCTRAGAPPGPALPHGDGPARRLDPRRHRDRGRHQLVRGAAALVAVRASTLRCLHRWPLDHRPGQLRHPRVVVRHRHRPQPRQRGSVLLPRPGEHARRSGGVR
ncbi:MAG: hypothetical protein JWM89_1955 [Acidimicrobiales bacterium]|nr:hypothetical protein [Acidimicrobiales bacterium]